MAEAPEAHEESQMRAAKPAMPNTTAAASSEQPPFSSEDAIELAAHVAAMQEAEAELVKLNSRIELAKTLIDLRRHHREQRADKRLDLEVHAQELQTCLTAAWDRVDHLHEGVAAVEVQLALSRRLLKESAPKLEALKARRSVAEEQFRVETIRTGVLHEKLRERKQQLAAVQRQVLDQRLRVGLKQWRERHLRQESIQRWHANALLERAALAFAERRRAIQAAAIL